MRAAASPGARIVVAVVGVLLLTPGSAGAVETDRFGVEPFPLFDGGRPRRAFELSLAPGGSAEEQVRIWNKTRRPLTLRVYGAGVETVGGSRRVAAYEDRATGAGGWLRPDAAEIVLDPLASRVVAFRVRAPAVMPDTARQAALVVEGEGGVSSEGVDIVARLALIAEVRRASAFLWGLSWLLILAAALAAGVAAAHLVRARAERASEGAPVGASP